MAKHIKHVKTPFSLTDRPHMDNPVLSDNSRYLLRIVKGIDRIKCRHTIIQNSIDIFTDNLFIIF